MDWDKIAEEIVIDGIKYDCVSCDTREFTLKCSLMDVQTIHELYNSRQKVPIHFRGISTVSFIFDIKETVSRDNMINVLIELA